MDALSVVFFLIAGIWLVAALCYSLLVLCFMRMRANGQLGSMYDENFGRVPLPFFGDDQGRWYIPMGCIFRRYARHLNLDDERPNVRFFTRKERRAAMEILLLSDAAKKSAIVTAATANRKAFQSTSTSMRLPAWASWQWWQRWNSTATTSTARAANNDKSATEGAAVAATVAISSCSRNTASDMVDVETGSVHDDHDENDDDALSETGPICSICLGEFVTADNAASATCDEEANNTAATAAAAEKVFMATTCTHCYHEACILSWLQRQSNTECPCCRVPLVNEDDVWATVKRLRREKRKQLQKQLESTKKAKRRASLAAAAASRKSNSATRRESAANAEPEDTTERDVGSDDTEVDA
jgi:Zinc finger, C3HC4 type (RING finger)